MSRAGAVVELAGCIILDARNRVLLLRRNTPCHVQWETPGGTVEPDEPPEEAAIRAVKEEIGLDVAIQFGLGSREFSESGKRFLYPLFLAQAAAGEPKLLDYARFDKLEYLALDEVKARRAELSPHAKKVLEEFEGGVFGLL